MRSRLYATAFAGFAVAIFGLVVAANALFDPEGVLGTGVVQATSLNDRLMRVNEYKRSADQYDGLLFGSSRTPGIPVGELSRRMGANFANFSQLGGNMVDYEPVLEYVLRTKHDNGQRLRAVFLLLDLDGFGTASPTNKSLQTLQPPELTGESVGHFRWRYLTAIQYGPWREAVSMMLARLRARGGTAVEVKSPPVAVPTPAAQAAAAQATVIPVVTPFDRAVLRPAGAAEPVRVARPIVPSEQQRQLALLKRFVQLCRQNDIQLVVAATPLNRRLAALYRRQELIRRRDEIASIVPLWDFGSPDWLSDQPGVWLDEGHFQPQVGKMMLDAMFDPGRGSAPADFGHLYGGEQSNGALDRGSLRDGGVDTSRRETH
jgi:hypothetical protein